MAIKDIAYATPFNPKVSLEDLGINRSGSLFAIDASDFDAAAGTLFQLSDYIGNTEKIIHEIRAIARRDMQEHFEQEEAPSGQKWVQLSPKYVIEKENAGYSEHPYLVREGRLKKAALSQKAWTVSHDSVMFNTSVLPWSKGKNSIQYWSVHQFGESVMQGHERWHNPETNRFEAHSTNSIGYAGVPARPFIGLSEKAGDEILTLIEGWIDYGMTEAVQQYKLIGKKFKGRTITGVFQRSNGKMQYRTGGKFGPMV